MLQDNFNLKQPPSPVKTPPSPPTTDVVGHLCCTNNQVVGPP